MFLVTRVPRNIAVSSAHPLRQIADGLAYVGQNQLVLGTITLDLFAVFIAGTNALLPLYAHDILHVGPRGLNELAPAPPVGAADTAPFFPSRPPQTNVHT